MVFGEDSDVIVRRKVSGVGVVVDATPDEFSQLALIGHFGLLVGLVEGDDQLPARRAGQFAVRGYPEGSFCIGIDGEGRKRPFRVRSREESVGR